jgi:hypothetical protein
MGLLSTVFFALLGISSFAFAVLLIGISNPTLLVALVHQSRQQDRFSKIIESLPTEIYCLTDIGNLAQLKLQLMLEFAVWRATFATAISYIDDEAGNLQSKILQYNFVNALLTEFRTFNRKLDMLLNSFPAPPELPGEFDN